jgi:kinesin family protein 15
VSKKVLAMQVFMLNVRLAEAESLTHDVIRDLVGVKLDITNYTVRTSDFMIS